jgi:hypothetical protein
LPNFDEGFASVDEVTDAVGSVSFAMDNCHPDTEYAHNSDNRMVHVTLSKVPDDFEQRHTVIDELLRWTAQYAWGQCPQPYYDFDRRQKDDFHYDLDQVNIVGPDGMTLVSGTLGGRGMDLYGDQALWSSKRGYVWRRYRNVIAERRQEAAVEQRREQAVAVRQEQQAVTKAENEHAGRIFFNWIKAIGALALLLWLWASREAIARWYYFNFNPHPAEAMVQQTIAAGQASSANAQALARALGDLPPDNDILRRVRIEQAERLVNSLQYASAARARELAERDRIATIEAHERAAYYGMQEAIALAAVALEKAKAAYQAAIALRSARG